MFPQQQNLLQVGIQLEPFVTNIGSNFQLCGKLKNFTKTKFKNVKVVMTTTKYNYLSFCNIDLLPPEGIQEFSLMVIVKSNNIFSLPEKGHIHVKTGSGRLLFTQEYTNKLCCYKNTICQVTPKKPYQCFNILLMGPSKSGKSSFINSVLSMIQNFESDDVFEGIGPNTKDLRQYMIPNSHFALWDSFDCFKFRKEELLATLKGEMPIRGWVSGLNMSDYEEAMKQNQSSSFLRKIHMMIFFITREILEDEEQLKIVNQQIRCLPLLPIIIFSKADLINMNLLENPLQDEKSFDNIDNYLIRISNALQVPPNRIFCGVNYTSHSEERRNSGGGEKEKRKFQIDKNNFVIMDHVLKSILANPNY